MSNFLGTLTIVANQKTAFTAPNEGLKALRIGNESGLSCVIKMQSCGVEKTLYPSTVDWFPLKTGFNGNVEVNPMVVLNNVTTFPASELLFDAIGLLDPEDGSAYPMALPRVTNQGNASVVPQASTSIVNDGNAANTQILESTVSGDGASAVHLTNDGVLALGSAAHHGSVSFDNGLMSSDGNGHLSVARINFHQGSLTRIASDALVVNNAPAFYNHSLGVVPDFCICQVLGTTPGTYSCIYDNTSMSGTQVKLTGSVNGLNVQLITVKM